MSKDYWVVIYTSSDGTVDKYVFNNKLDTMNEYIVIKNEMLENHLMVASSKHFGTPLEKTVFVLNVIGGIVRLTDGYRIDEFGETYALYIDFNLNKEFVYEALMES